MAVVVSLSESRRLARNAQRAKYRPPSGPTPGQARTTCPFCLTVVATCLIVRHERRCAAEYRNPPDPHFVWGTRV